MKVGVVLPVTKYTLQLANIDWSFEFAWVCFTLGRSLIRLSGWAGGRRRRRLRDAHAAAAHPGGPVSRTGPDLPRVAGMRRNASQSRNRRASASLTRPGVSVAAWRQPPTHPDQRQGLWLRLRGQQDQQGAADLHQVQCSQRSRAVRPRRHIAPTPSLSLSAANSGSTVQRFA